MAAPNQYQQPYGQQPQWMPQGMNQQSMGNPQQSYAQLMNQRNYGPQQQPGQNKDFGQKLGDFFLGTNGEYDQVSNLHPHQQYAQDQVLGSGLQALQNPYAGFDPIAQQAMQDFHGQYIPGLVEQFTAGYNNSDRGTSALTGALGSAGSGLQAMLAAQKAQYGLANRQQGLREVEFGAKPQFESVYREGTPGFLSDAAGLAAQAGLMYATGGLTGAEGISNLIGQGVTAAKKLGGGTKEKKPYQAPQQSRQQYEQQIAQTGKGPSGTSYGQTSIGPTMPQKPAWYNYLG